MLTREGASVKTRDRIHQKFVIIDQRIVWYGSINLLSYGASEESIMRIDSMESSGTDGNGVIFGTRQPKAMAAVMVCATSAANWCMQGNSPQATILHKMDYPLPSAIARMYRK